MTTTSSIAQRYKKIIDWKRWFQIVHQLGDQCNGRKDRFDKADILEQAIEICSNGKLTWVDGIGRDHHDNELNLDIEFKFSKKALFSSITRKPTKNVKMKIKNSLGETKSTEIADPADYYMFAQEDAVGIISYTEMLPYLKIVGDGEQGEYLIDKYSSEKIIFTGKKFNKELITEYNSASCFVCPSLFEPWGLVVNEALSAGLPVIASKEVGACFDLIKDKETGFIAEDMQEFGQMMLTLFNDAELLKRYSKNASDLMKNNWNYDLYDNCLNKAIKKVEQWQ